MEDFKEEFSHTILHNQNVFDQFKALQIDKKKKEEQKKAEEEEKIKQKVREKALAKLNANDDLIAAAPMTRHETVATKIHRGSSMSAR